MSEMSTATSSKVIQITDVEEYDEFKKNKRGIIFYGAEWCEACQGIKDIFTRIANRYHKRVAMAYCDINVCGLDFSRVPVFVAMHQGKQINSLEGANDDNLKMLIREVIDYNPDAIPKQPEPDDSPGRLDDTAVQAAEPKQTDQEQFVVGAVEPKPDANEEAKPQAIVMILAEEPKSMKKLPAPVEEPSSSNVSMAVPKDENKPAPRFVMFEEIGLRPKKGAKK